MQLLAQQSPSARNVRAVRRAFLNVETMRSLRFATGDHILIRKKEALSNTENNTEDSPGSVVIAWPSFTVSENRMCKWSIVNIIGIIGTLEHLHTKVE
ncbi:hypothetical protein BX616_001419 [Lobosporangium transversale]|nr:hypothetical protein BX616_001419 [Lobosporangium transversale]